MIEKFRYKIIIEYLGTNFSGWQRQKNAISVQEVLEEAIYKFTKEKIVIFSGGRTDAGVHAAGQVAHFDLGKSIKTSDIIRSVNHFVRPHKVTIIDCEEVDLNFHARFSATARHYLYKIINRDGKVVINENQVWWVREHLNIENMIKASKHLIGNHDFTSFRAKHCQAKSPIKTLSKIEILQKGELIEFHFSAPSFLHHMVRNIVGTLVLVGKGKWSEHMVLEALEKRDRCETGANAPACGLYLTKIDYISPFGIVNLT